MQSGFVYILRPRGQPYGQEIIKIGMTTRSVRTRVKELSTGSVAGFDILYSIEVDNARWFEKELHRRYAEYKVQGGGQEFFRVSARTVVQEIEQIATAISRKRAISARDAEYEQYKKLIGARRSELLISIPMILAFPVIWFYGYNFVVQTSITKFAHEEAIVVIIAFFCIYGLPVLIWKIGARLYRFLNKLLILPKFGHQLALKEQELRAKYPLAYS